MYSIFFHTLSAQEIRLDWVNKFSAGKKLTTDWFGNVYVTGSFTGNSYFDTHSWSPSISSNGGEDVFIQKLDGQGNLQWVHTFGSIGCV